MKVKDLRNVIQDSMIEIYKENIDDENCIGLYDEFGEYKPISIPNQRPMTNIDDCDIETIIPCISTITLSAYLCIIIKT